MISDITGIILKILLRNLMSQLSGRSVGIVRARTKATEFVLDFNVTTDPSLR
jgi:hypothetical protein